MGDTFQHDFSDDEFEGEAEGRFGSLFGPYFIKVGVTVSQGSNPLNETELTRKNLLLKMGEKKSE